MFVGGAEQSTKVKTAMKIMVVTAATALKTLWQLDSLRCCLQ